MLLTSIIQAILSNLIAYGALQKDLQIIYGASTPIQERL